MFEVKIGKEGAVVVSFKAGVESKVASSRISLRPMRVGEYDTWMFEPNNWWDVQSLHTLSHDIHDFVNNLEAGEYEPKPDKAIVALGESIDHWRELVVTLEDSFVAECPLCDLYHSAGTDWCLGCPIRVDTGRPGCSDTPFGAYADEHTPANALDEVHYLETLYLKVAGKLYGCK